MAFVCCDQDLHCLKFVNVIITVYCGLFVCMRYNPRALANGLSPAQVEEP